MQILNEELKTILFEEVDADKPKRKGILKTIKGIVADCKLNRNGRIYPRELWQNVINSDYVQELLASKTLFGETDHPAERLEMSLQEVSHCISDIKLDGDNVIATIDILDTPNGNLISRLLDYGSKIGVSSRGAGDVGSDNVVDPDTYTFVGFDLVARPSCAAAVPDVITESSKVLTESEIANVLKGYTQLSSKLDNMSKNSFNYIVENETKSYKNDIINKLIEQASDINNCK